MTHRYAQAVTVAARLLLVVVLALGVFVMHTVGHPSEGSGSGMGAASHAVGTHAMSGEPAAAHSSTLSSSDSSELTGAISSPHEPGMSMDLASLCVAVLGAWALAALLHAAFAGRCDWLAALATGVRAVVRPNPPPRAPDLAQLSILRI
ncbi:DUF6153 family protein [Streptomyces sp. NPDC005407]|uniref:DUF6153 family protein n=1 Tax=Streptomyces sp. NPDC005407 TaxID=3155340 RepID=UPI0033BE065B